MRFVSSRITIINVRKPAEKSINQQLQWLGTSLGLFNIRDRDKSCFRIFIELIKAKEPRTSDIIADNLGLSRGTVIHHINRLMEAGLVVHEKNAYLLRVENLSDLISELEKDIKRTLDDLKQVASNIDNRLQR